MKRFYIDSDHEPNPQQPDFQARLEFEVYFHPDRDMGAVPEFDGMVLNLSTGILKHVDELCEKDRLSIEQRIEQACEDLQGLMYRD